MTAVASNVRRECPFCSAKPVMKRSYNGPTALYRLECHGKDCRVKPMTAWAPEFATATRWWNRRVECAGV